MKIRKANILDERTVSNVYIYENKKEEYTLIAIPDIEWSLLVHYEEETEALKTRLCHSLSKLIASEYIEPIANKILHWVREM